MPLDSDDFATVVSALRAGKPVIVPTDTLFGVGVSPVHAPSPAVLYQIKGRPSDKPVAWLVASASDLDAYGRDVPEYARVLAHAFWPGALTLIVNAGDAVPDAYRSQAGTIGLRMPADELTCAITREIGHPLAVTSANLSGQSDPRRFEDIDAAVRGRVAAAIDDAQEKSGIGSTVLDCTAPTYRILREGAITKQDIDAALTPSPVR